MAVGVAGPVDGFVEERRLVKGFRGRAPETPVDEEEDARCCCYRPTRATGEVGLGRGRSGAVVMSWRLGPRVEGHWRANKEDISYGKVEHF